MKKAKYFTISLVILGGLFLFLSPTALPNNIKLEDVLNLNRQADVIIIFNSGSWGNTPLEKVEDFAPIIEGIQKTLNEWGGVIIL